MTALAKFENTQWVCCTEPQCLCCNYDSDGYSCECEHHTWANYCIICFAKMILIDADTSEVLST
jgi:hypothetical protein